MSIAEDTVELIPGPKFWDDSRGGWPEGEDTNYWIKEGKIIYKIYPVTRAHVESFRFYRSGFAKDCKNCYIGGTRLTGANPATFRMLNYCYATDGESVWVLGGKLKDADATTFRVLDEGESWSASGNGEDRMKSGYARDATRVFYRHALLRQRQE